MHPILFSFGRFEFKTINIFLFLSFLSSLFIFYKRGKEEHFNINYFFDAFFSSYIFALFIGRTIYALMHWDLFSNNIFLIFNFIDVPGVSRFGFIFAMTFYIFIFSKKKKWDAFDILDYWVTALSIGLFFYFLGAFFDGSFLGITTDRFGVVYEGSVSKRIPVDLLSSFFYLFLFVFLLWAEQNYRNFSWYRKGKKSAKSGFLFMSFLIFSSVFNILLSGVVDFSKTEIPFIHTIIIFLLIFIYGVFVFLIRSGKISRKK